MSGNPIKWKAFLKGLGSVTSSLKVSQTFYVMGKIEQRLRGVTTQLDKVE